MKNLASDPVDEQCHERSYWRVKILPMVVLPAPKHAVTLKYRKILALFIIGNKTIAILF